MPPKVKNVSGSMFFLSFFSYDGMYFWLIPILSCKIQCVFYARLKTDSLVCLVSTNTQNKVWDLSGEDHITYFLNFLLREDLKNIVYSWWMFKKLPLLNMTVRNRWVFFLKLDFQLKNPEQPDSWGSNLHYS